MRSKAIFMALLALAFGAQAKPVLMSQAGTAAKAWAQRRAALGARIGTTVSDVREHRLTDGQYLYSARMKGGGTVILSGDTTIEPVLAFSSSSLSLPEVLRTKEGEMSPLEAMLNARRVSVETTSPNVNVPNVRKANLLTASPATAGVQASTASTAAEREWERLLNTPRPLLKAFAMPSPTPVQSADELDDLRVAPLLKTAWGQDVAYTDEDSDCAVDCFNSKTPLVEVTYKDTVLNTTRVTNEHCLCGCVATAMAQLMKFWEWPGSVESFDNFIFKESTWPLKVTAKTVGDYVYETKVTSLTGVSYRQVLSTDSGKYDWAGMTDYPLSPAGTNEMGETVWAGEAVTKSNCLAIGKLTYDCGVAVGMAWGLDSSGLRSDKSQRIPDALVGNFSYSRALLCEGSALSSEADAKLRANAICANLDAGHPVLLLISGNGGHAVVGDGYGFTGAEETPYVHLNMGWNGQNDVWYNLPLINVDENPESFTGFSVINGVVYNVYPDRASGEIVSGHVTHNGASAEDVTVSLYAGDEPVGSTQTSSNGVYSFFVEPGKAYTVRASVGNVSAEAVTPTIVASTGDTVGNSWGNDLSLDDPPVRIGNRFYASADEALDSAVGGDVVEVLLPAELKRSHGIDCACALVATNDDPFASTVAYGGTAGLSVVSGGFLTLSNIVFAGAAPLDISVDVGGSVAVAGLVTNIAVSTADAKGFAVAGALAVDLEIDCAMAKEVGDAFGVAVADVPLEVVSAAAARIRCKGNDGLVGRAVWTEEGIILKWAEVVDPDEAVCYFVESGDLTNLCGSVESALREFAAASEEGRLGTDAEIVVFTNATVSESLVIGSDLRIRGTEGAVLSGNDKKAGFTVTDGTLEIVGLRIDGYEGEGLFTIDGDEAELVFRDVELANIVASDSHVTDSDGYSVAVRVLNGRFEATDSSFENCRNMRPSVACRGGAIYIAGDGKVSLSNVTITGCAASESGGGVYVGSKAVLTVAGAMRLWGNLSGAGSDVPDDIYTADGNARLEIGELDPEESVVGVRAFDRLSDGDVFATYTGGAAAVTNAAESIFNDADSALEVAWREGTLAEFSWTERTDRRVKEGVVRVSGCTDFANGDYASLEDALAQARPWAATITLLDDVVVSADLTIDFPVTIRSASGINTITAVGTLIRVPRGGELELSNVTVTSGTTAAGLFKVSGGSLTLHDGATVTGFRGDGFRDASAIVVWNGGEFVMEKGAVISDCVNSYVDEASGSGCGAAVLVDNGAAEFRGGSITGCRSNDGAVFIGNKGLVNVSGELVIDANFRLDGATPDNLVVHDLGRMALANPLSGSVGYTEGVAGDERIFGRVAADFGGSDADMMSSAQNFTHDTDGDIGMAVRNGSETLLVWSDAIDDNGVFTDKDGDRYAILKGTGIPKVEVAHPVAAEGLVYNGEAQIGVPEGRGYALAGTAVATNAGTYTATATIRPGYAWDDGNPSASTQLVWTIAKAVYDLSSISFKGTNELVYTGTEQSLYLTGVLPEGVIATYANNTGTNVGDRTEATLTLTIDPAFAANLTFLDEDGNPVSEKELKATLVIVSGDTPVEPDPIAFKSITRVTDTEWTLVVTGIVPRCHYRLIWTKDLEDGFTNTGAWKQITVPGDWTTNVITSGEAWFWRAEGRNSEPPVE